MAITPVEGETRATTIQTATSFDIFSAYVAYIHDHGMELGPVTVYQFDEKTGQFIVQWKLIHEDELKTGALEVSLTDGTRTRIEAVIEIYDDDGALIETERATPTESRQLQIDRMSFRCRDT